MDCSTWIALGSMLIALVALGFSLCGYFVYDRPIKSLQKEKLQQEALDAKRAKLNVSYRALLVNSGLTIHNNGQVIAENIVVELCDIPDLLLADGESKYQIKQLEPTEKSQNIPIVGNAPYHLKVKLTWDDKSGKRLSQNYFLDRKS